MQVENIPFTNPILSPSSTRPIPPFTKTNDVPKSKDGRVSIRISLDKTHYVAGENITGRLQIKSLKNVKLGEISIHLVGYEGMHERMITYI